MQPDRMKPILILPPGEMSPEDIKVSRKIMSRSFWTDNGTRREVCELYVDILVRGTPLDPRPSKQEQEREIFDEAKANELRSLARAEAKADRAAMKGAKEKKP